MDEILLQTPMIIYVSPITLKLVYCDDIVASAIVIGYASSFSISSLLTYRTVLGSIDPTKERTLKNENFFTQHRGPGYVRRLSVLVLCNENFSTHHQGIVKQNPEISKLQGYVINSALPKWVLIYTKKLSILSEYSNHKQMKSYEKQFPVNILCFARDDTVGECLWSYKFWHDARKLCQNLKTETEIKHSASDNSHDVLVQTFKPSNKKVPKVPDAYFDPQTRM